MLKYILIILLCLSLTRVSAQELYCNVDVSAQQVASGTDRKVYETMQNAIYEFMNNRSWTNFEYKQYEKIECSILMNITERPASDQLVAMTIAMSRPVFNSTYTTVFFNFIERD